MKKTLLFASAVAVLFSSCSTDNTQDVIGNEEMSTISAAAAYQQEATRTYLEGKKVFWSKGDALGVFGANGPQVQFGLTSGEGTASAKFAGNKNYLKVGEPVYAYYPYTKGTSLEDTSKVKLEILAEQTFEKVGSFDAAMAPAYAYIPKLESKDDVAFTMQGAAAYLSVPVKGMGTLESLSLYIDGQQLNGVAAVDIAGADDPETKDVDETPAIKFDTNSQASDEQKTNTVNCGGAVVLEPFKAVEVMFVVPAGVDVKKEITVTAVVDGNLISHKRPAEINSEGYVTIANEKATIVYDTKATTLVDAAWSFGMEDAYLVYSDDNATSAFGDGLTAEERFLAYAYLTKPGAAAYEQGANLSEVFADYIYAAEALKLESSENVASLEAMIYEDALDFAAYTKAWAQTQYDATNVVLGNNADDAAAKFWKKVYAWYKGNEGAIESLAYNAVNGTIADDYVTIMNLTVKGNGISAGASLSGLKFENIAVVSDASVAGLIAASNKMSYTVYRGTETDAIFTNILIGEGNSVSTSHNAALVGGIFGNYYASKAATTVVKSDYAVEMNGAVVGQLYGDLKANNDIAINLTENFVDVESATPIFAKISTTNGVLHNVSVNGSVAPATVKNCNVAAAVEGVSLCVNGTYYWNGGVATEVNLANGYSAEELAYDLAQGEGDIILTNDIDMQCVYDMYGVAPIDTVEPITTAGVGQYLTLAHDSNSEYTVESLAGEDKNNVNKFEIKNIIAVSDQARAALFGVKADISNVTISNFTMYVYKSTANRHIATIAGLAGTGVAKNVTVNNLAINIASDAIFDTDLQSIGGVFATATPEAIENVTVSALAINYAGEEALDVRAGVIAGTLNVEPTTTPVVLKGIKLTGEASDYAVSNFGELYKQSTKIAAFVNTKNYAGAYPFGTISVDNAAFPANSRGKAYVGVDKAFETWSTAGAGMGNRLAAGVVFSDELTSAANSTVVVGATDTEYDYSFEFTGDVRVGNVNKTNFFGFTKK